jgi:hypothetical protein
MLVVQRVEVMASLDDPRAALEWARREASAGDASWAQWVAEYERGEALILRLEVKLVAAGDRHEVIEVSNPGVFAEMTSHPPQLERQIAEMASKDYGVIAERLRRRGHAIDTFELGEMYVHVELDPALRASLLAPGAAGSTHPHPVAG